jgi:hypothetical protein
MPALPMDSANCNTESTTIVLSRIITVCVGIFILDEVGEAKAIGSLPFVA